MLLPGSESKHGEANNETKVATELLPDIIEWTAHIFLRSNFLRLDVLEGERTTWLSAISDALHPVLSISTPVRAEV